MEEYLCTRCKKRSGVWANGLCDPCNQLRIAEDAQELAAVERAIAHFWTEANAELRPGLHYREHDGRAGWFNYDEEDDSIVIISLQASDGLFRRRYRMPKSGNIYSTIDNYVLTGQLPDVSEIASSLASWKSQGIPSRKEFLMPSQDPSEERFDLLQELDPANWPETDFLHTPTLDVRLSDERTKLTFRFANGHEETIEREDIEALVRFLDAHAQVEPLVVDESVLKDIHPHRVDL